MLKDPRSVVFLAFSVVFLVVVGPFASPFLASVRTFTGTFSEWQFFDSVIRPGGRYACEVYIWFAWINMIGMFISWLEGPSKKLLFFMCTTVFFAMFGGFVLASNMSVASGGIQNYEKFKHDEQIKQFAIANQTSLDEGKPVLINGVTVADQSDPHVWTEDFLIRSGVLAKGTGIEKVIARCEATCTKLEIWENNTLRLVDLRPSASLYRQ